MPIDRHAHYLIIDDLGEEQPWPSAHILNELDSSRADFDTLDYIVRNLGYALIIDRPDFLRLRLRPLLVSSRTVAALFYYLAERSPQRTGISWFGDVWRDEVCGHPKDLFRRLTEILHASTRSDLTERFLSTRRSIDAILNPAGHAFAPLLRAWLKGSREDLIATARAHGLWDRAMLAERDPERGDFVFRHSGGAIQLYDAGWGGQAVGRRISEQPDGAYGRWIEQGCAAVDEARSARVELVHALVAGPDCEPQRWRYERLMLPFQGKDDRRVVMSISAPDPGPGR
jgi:hypothetical protein